MAKINVQQTDVTIQQINDTDYILDFKVVEFDHFKI
jgi:hypothetical protein